MADYKDILSGTLGKLADKVKETASSSGVLDVYAQGANRAKAFGQLAKMTLELNGEHEELQRIYTEIGRLYFEQAKDAPEGFFVPLFEQANRVSDSIRAKRAKIDELKEHYGVTEQSDIDVEIGDFDDVVSATEADGMTVEIKTKEE
ncbi:MAG: hypothetical protein IKI39_02665 [Oscillospiraceae bacterium]|nr:hypothetical protein [Oscillospiraceae bacterium]